MEYVTNAEPEITRTLGLSPMVATSLPVAINVEDFFRGTRYTIFLTRIHYDTDPVV